MAWAPDYCTLAEAKAFLHVDDTDDDVQIAVAISAASRTIDRYAGRQFGKVAVVETREYATVYDRHLGCYVAEIDDLQTTTGLIVLDENAVEVTDYALAPENALQKGKPYERILTSTAGPFTITASWGWTAVPVSVKQATLLQAARFMARRDSPFGVAGSPAQGSELRLLARVDPDVAVSLDPYRRNWWAA